MKYLFSKNNKIGSKLISWASSFESLPLLDRDKIPSHVAIEINGQVYESTMLKGVRIIPKKQWSSINTELYSIKSNKKANKFLSAILSSIGRRYDWVGIFYFIFRFIGLILFRIKLPRTNTIHHKSKYFCTELVSYVEEADLSMTTPAKLCNDLLEKEKIAISSVEGGKE
jgi:hypothetical protein